MQTSLQLNPLAQLFENLKVSNNPVHGVLFDIDDTFTSHGRITAAAYAALEALDAAGIACVAVTGRPAGWCDMIARFWPVKAVIGENGAFYMHKVIQEIAQQATLKTTWIAQIDDIAGHRATLAAIAARVMQSVPGCAVASDQAYRVCDLAIDFAEDVLQLDALAVEHIAALLRNEGMTAKVSSIHVNAWFGSHDKLTTTALYLRTLQGISLQAAQKNWLFVGDSPNDSPMFAAFANSVGVANVQDFAGRMPTMPQYVCTAHSGAGFVELVKAILQHNSHNSV